jgi:anthranilate phosphoribosyltransferase
MSSKSGAADVLEALGVNLTSDGAILEECLREAKCAFLFAQNHHPAMRHVGPARREIGQRTIFNLLGPLSNPAGVKRQLLGVFAPDFVAPVTEALRRLGAERAWVICGPGNLDELFPADGNRVLELSNGDIIERPLIFSGHASDNAREALKGGDAADNARALHALLSGQSQNEAYRQIVELNAGAALVAAGACLDLGDALLISRESLDGGEALARLDALVAITRSAPETPA